MRGPVSNLRLFVLSIVVFFTINVMEARRLPKSLRKKGIQSAELDRVAGFFAFRDNKGTVEYILLQKLKEQDDWSPPKGHIDPLPCGDGMEDPLEAAKREMWEETGVEPQDYSILLEFPYIIRYNTSDGVQKQVDIWPAKLTNVDQEIVLNPGEHSAFQWLIFADARAIIKKQYREALVATNAFIEGLKK